MILYKYTQKDGTTYGGCKWGKGVTHKAKGNGNVLCSSDYIHAFTDPLLGEFCRYLWTNDYDNYKNLIMWECEGEIDKTDGLKVGCKELTTIKRICKPKEFTLDQRRGIAIHISLLILGKIKYKNKRYQEQIKIYTDWANDWLNGNHNKDAAYAASAASAARVAASAASVAADAARVAADAAYAAYAAADAARVAASAASAAADVARVAADVAKDFTKQVIQIIHQVIEKPDV